MRDKQKQKTDSSIHHCMVVHAYYPLGETRVEREAQALVASDYQVDVICLRDEGEASVEVVDGNTVHRLPVRRSKRKGILIQLFEYLTFFALVFFKLTHLHWQHRYQIVQVHNLPDFLIFAALVPKLTGAKLLLDLHDLMPEFYACRFETDLTSLPVRLVIWQEQLSCRFADHVITVSEHWRQALIARGVPADKCSVVMNVADEHVFQWSDEFVSRKRDNGRFRLIYHGTIVQRYGLDLAIEAVDQVKDDIPGIELVILGKGDYVATLTQMVQERELTQQVTIYDELRPVQELPALIRQADLAVVPYRDDTFTDGLLPTKLMEYAALGLPAIAARTTAIEAYFANTMVAFFEPNDAQSLARCLSDLYNSPEQLTTLSLGSKKFNERYSWHKVSAEYKSVIKHLLNNRALVSAAS